MTYQQTLNYLYNNLPMYQRVGPAAYKADLGNIVELMDTLGNPQNQFKSIHVAGTNGKGSSSHMLASILQEAGFKVGLYTSPHLKSFTERVRINGLAITEQEVVDFVEEVKPIIKKIEPSFFEITVAMAFGYFAKHKVDIAIIEVGLGGRLDSTNIITPEVSLITNIGLDHQALLGDTLEKIAYEKAGIIKKGIPVVISQKQEEIKFVFENKAAKVGTEISFATDYYSVEQANTERFNIIKSGKIEIEGIKLDLKGSYQQLNLPGVLQTINLLQVFSIKEKHIKKGLEHVVTNTGLKGRWQFLGKKPLIICDTGHNIGGVKMIVEQLQNYTCHQLHIVWGMVEDKSINEILKLLPKNAHYYFCAANIPRALNAALLTKAAIQFNLRGNAYESVNQAILAAKKNAATSDLLFIGGSTFVVAEIDEL
ncbi:MAG: bifunctional folylpolyglutamate synthase/dihydrofolate synthase [Cyclobacteriaceae bacterium]|nr:bifunctional folylpolyglutamate synthase/dihydrofolate synthase [Cyclobacteriaceae bacterium]